MSAAAQAVRTARVRAPRMNRRRVAGLVVGCVLLGGVMLLSLGVGAKSVPPGTVWHALWGSAPPRDDYLARVVTDQRLPRTLIGALCGAALGLAGALAQALTRNPLADPGLLGVNAGAAAAMVAATALLGVGEFSALIWFCFAGAAVAALVVHLVGTAGRGGGVPARLALAGAAVGVTLSSVTALIGYLDDRTYERIRFWLVGSLAGKEMDALAQVLPFLLPGFVLALLLGRPLNALAMGEDVARSLGARVARTRVLGVLAVTVLCGAATSVAGPIAFVGLAVPHAVRFMTGPDQRWVLAHSFVYAPVLTLGADTLGRVLADEEFQVGVVTAWIGAPVFLWLVRGRRLAAL